MKSVFLSAALVSLGLVFAQGSFGEAPAVKAGDTIQQVLEAQKGKKVTIRLGAGDELTGKVTVVTKELLHLSGLTGRDFFDAVIEVSKIQVVIVRAKE